MVIAISLMQHGGLAPPQRLEWPTWNISAVGEIDADLATPRCLGRSEQSDEANLVKILD
jgi:hypothetical protein